MPTPEQNKLALDNLIRKVNKAIGKNDQTITSVIDTLLKGYGQGGGACTREHIIEVDTLPTEDIDSTVTYKCGDTYYRHIDEMTFKDILIKDGDKATSIFAEIAGSNTIIELHYAATRPIDNILVSATNVLHLYYIEDENIVLAYGDDTGTGINEWVPLFENVGTEDNPILFKGTITDISEMTETGTYALIGIEKTWKSYGHPYLIDVDKLPTENIIKDAIYRIPEEKCVDIIAYTEGGAYIGSVLLLLSLLLKTDIDIINVDSIESVTDPMPALPYIYYCRSDKKIYAYDPESGWSEGWAPGSESSDDGDGFPVVKDDYAYYKYSNAGFHDIAIVADGFRILLSSLGGLLGGTMSFTYHTIPSKTNEGILVSTAGDSPMYHCYYIEDEKDIFLYFLNEETGEYEWVSFAVIDSETEAQMSFKGIISDIGEALEDGYYAVGISGWVRHIMPRGTLTVYENNKIFDTREFASVQVALPTSDGKVVYG